MKIKKITLIEITTIILALVAAGVYFAPKFIADKELQKAAKIKSDNAIFTAKVIEEFSKDKNAKASVVAKKTIEELNSTTKNPYDKKKSAYTFESDCKSCTNVSSDDNTQMVITTSYDTKGELVARTVIKPPSFVTYTKFEDKE